MKKVIIILILCIIACWAYMTYSQGYVQYIPVVLNAAQGSVEAPQLEINKRKLRAVLDDHGEPWITEIGEVYITRRLAWNKKKVHQLTVLSNDFGISTYSEYRAYLDGYVKYIPVVLEDPNRGYVKAPEFKVDLPKLQAVLSSYHEQWEVRDGQLLITRKLALDPEMVHNYTQEANDFGE